VTEADSPDIDEESYGGNADSVCDLPNRFGECEMFEDLRDAAGLYIFFQILNTVCLLAWFSRIVASLSECICFPDWFAHIWPTTGLVFHFIGLVVWIELTETEFEECETVSRRAREPICAG
jgi:hypothetical protein